MRARAIVASVLATAWLAVPAVQYYGTVQRTNLQMAQPAQEAWAALDLTPAYVLLLAGTLLYAVLTVLAGRRAPHSGAAGEEAHS